VADAHSGAIRDANRIVAGPGLYPYAPAYCGRLAAPPYPPDDIEPGYGRPYIGGSETSSDRHVRGDVATTAPTGPQSGPSSKPSQDAAVPAIND